jgi:hypothetical protein
MKYLSVSYRSKVLNRLSDMAYRKGGTAQMRDSLSVACSKIYREIHEYKRNEVIWS